jgi:hypothetical protein
MVEKPNISTHEVLIPQELKKKTLRHVTMLVVFLVENHQKATHFLRTKYFFAKKNHLKVIENIFLLEDIATFMPIGYNFNSSLK